MKKTREKLYEKLTPQERAVLFFEAAARQDWEEVDRVNDTCPQKTFKADDWDYTRMKHRLHEASMFHKSGNDRLVIYALLTLVALLVYEEDETLDKLRDSFEQAIAAIKGRNLAWSEFCGKLGMKEATMDEAWQIHDPIPERFLAGFDPDGEISPSIKSYDTCSDMLMSLVF